MRRWLKLKSSLQIRVLILTILTAALVVVLIESISNWQTVTALENEIGGQVNRAAKQLAENLSHHAITDVPTVFKPALVPIRKIAPNVLRIDVYAQKKGAIILLDSTLKQPRAIEDFEKDVLTTRQPKTYMLENDHGKRMIVTVRPVTFSDQHIGFISMMSSLKPFRQLLAIHSQTRNYALAATILLLVITMTWMFQSSIYRNIHHLVTVISKFRQGKAEVRANEKLPGEFGELSGQLNGMLNQISAFHDQLKNNVDQATSSLSRRNQELNELNIQLRDMQKKLTQAERMAVVGQLTATFAHEIGSPLTAVSTHLQMLQEDQLSPAARRSVATAYEQLNRVCTIVEQLLKNTRTTAKRQPLNLVRLLANLCELMRPLAKSRQIEIRFSAQQEEMIMDGDNDQLQQLFLNLFDNAFDAVSSNGYIRIVLAFAPAPSSGLMIKFADSGQGIPQEKLNDIFKPFFTTKEIGKGTGLGLSVCNEIVKQHQGTITVNREAKETVFSIHFPTKSGDNEARAKITKDRSHEKK